MKCSKSLFFYCEANIQLYIFSVSKLLETCKCSLIDSNDEVWYAEKVEWFISVEQNICECVGCMPELKINWYSNIKCPPSKTIELFENRAMYNKCWLHWMHQTWWCSKANNHRRQKWSMKKRQIKIITYQ